MMQVQWRLGAFLSEHGLTAYRLAKALPDVREPTVYRLASAHAPQSVNLYLLGRVLQGLSTLTGHTVEVGDVMEVVQGPPTVPARRPAVEVAAVRPFARREPLPPLASGQEVDTTALVAEIRGK